MTLEVIAVSIILNTRFRHLKALDAKLALDLGEVMQEKKDTYFSNSPLSLSLTVILFNIGR